MAEPGLGDGEVNEPALAGDALGITGLRRTGWAGRSRSGRESLWPTEALELLQPLLHAAQKQLRQWREAGRCEDREGPGDVEDRQLLLRVRLP